MPQGGTQVVRRGAGLAVIGLACVVLFCAAALGAAAREAPVGVPAGRGVSLTLLGPASGARPAAGSPRITSGGVVTPASFGSLALSGGSRSAAVASSNAGAFLTALLSGVVPGAGQLRNGSVLRGLGYFAAEVGGWVAYGAFRNGSRDRRGELARLAGAYWGYDRYHAWAPDPDSCASHGCACGLWSEQSDQEILDFSQRSDRGRFYEYVVRDAYACGWDTPLSRDLYLELWGDRDALLSAKRWMGRVIFLNHLVSAVDAFVEARARRLQWGERTQLRFDVHGRPGHLEPAVRVTRRFGGPPTR